jgi:Glycosyl transferase family 11
MSTVIARLIGGLGNQMFQYAAGRALALRHRARLKLDVSGFERHGLRRYELQSYPVATSIATPQEIATCEQSAAGGRKAMFRSVRRMLGLTLPPSTRHYREPHFHFDAALAKQCLPVLIDGYWQSECYFADAADVIRGELTPRAPLEPANAAMAAEIGRVEAVSLHVRRGDYVSNAHTNAYHGVCSLDYYRAAVEHIKARTSKPHLFVFSDDRDWTRANLRSDLPTTFVDANPPERGFRDMQLMSRCRHHIIANSSFSWWGAWLNPSPFKIVVAPQRWFAAGPNDTRDLLPTNWVRL